MSCLKKGKGKTPSQARQLVIKTTTTIKHSDGTSCRAVGGVEEKVELRG